MRVARIVSLVALAVTALALVASCGGDGDEEAAPATAEEAPAMTEEAATEEAAAEGGAAAGPNLDASQPSFDLVIERVTNGKGPMPAFGQDGTLNEQEILDVAAYVVQSTQG
jgi:mono/diheme cytochrome c family protein